MNYVHVNVLIKGFQGNLKVVTTLSEVNDYCHCQNEF